DSKNVGTNKPIEVHYELGTWLTERYALDETDRSATAGIYVTNLSVTPDDKEIYYGEAKPSSYTYTATGLKNSETIETTRGEHDFNGSLAYTTDYSDVLGAYSPVGTYTISVSGESNNNYTITYNTGVLTVKQTKLVMSAPVWSSAEASVITWEAAPSIGDVAVEGYELKLYQDSVLKDTVSVGADKQTHDFSGKMSGLFGSFTVSIQAIASETNNTGKANVLDSDVVTSGPRTAVTITGSNADKIYDGTPLTYSTVATLPSTGFTNSALLTGDHITSLKLNGSITDYDGGKNGSNTADNLPSDAVIKNAAGEDVTGNYFITYIPGNLTINKRAVTLKADDKLASAGHGSVYGATLDTLTVSVTNGAEATLSQASMNEADIISELGAVSTGSFTVRSDVGTHALTVSYTDTHGNYTVTTTPGSYEITKANLTASHSAASYVYDGTSHSADITVTALEGDTPVVYYALTALDNSNYTTAGSTTAPGLVNVNLSGDTVVPYTVYYYATCSNYKDISGSETITVTRRPVEFVSAEGYKVYDGEALTKNKTTGTTVDYALSSAYPFLQLADKDEVASISIVGSITNAGSVDNVISAAVIKDKTDSTKVVNNNYDIHYHNGQLIVAKATDTLTVTEDATKVYDAEPVTVSGCSRSRNGGPSDNPASLIFKYFNSNKQEMAEKPENAGTYYVKVTEDETANYNAAESEFKEFTISKRPVTFTSEGGEWVYDAKDHRKDVTTGLTPDFTVSPAAAGTGITAKDSLSSIVIAGYIHDAGEKPNIIRDAVIIRTSDSHNVTDNYDITYTPGRLKVTKAKDILDITSVSDKTYDALVADTPVYTRVREGASDTDNTASVVFEYFNDHLGTPGSKLIAAPTDAGKYWVRIAEGESRNYFEAASACVSFEIFKKNIKLTADNKEKTYGDANPAFTMAVDPVDGIVNAADMAALAIKAETTATQSSPVGTYPIELKYTESGNYDITVVNAELTVKEAEMTASLSDLSAVYDAKAHSFALDVTADKVEGDAPTVYYSLDTVLDDNNYLTEGTTTQPEFKYVKLNAGSVDPYSFHYYITCSNYKSLAGSGSFLLAKRPIEVTAGSAQEEYKEGISLSEDSYEFTAEYGLAEGDSVKEYKIDGVQKVKGWSYNVAHDFVMNDAADADVTDNYDITYVDGILAVGVLLQNIEAEDYVIEYDGKQHTVKDIAAKSNAGTVITYTPDQGDDSTVYTAPVSMTVKLSAPETEGYAPAVKRVKYAITPRKLTISAVSLSKAEDGKPFEASQYEKWEITSGTLAEGNTVDLTASDLKVEAEKPDLATKGSCKNLLKGNSGAAPKAVIVDSLGNDVSAFYEITYEDGLLVIETTANTLPPHSGGGGGSNGGGGSTGGGYSGDGGGSSDPGSSGKDDKPDTKETNKEEPKNEGNSSPDSAVPVITNPADTLPETGPADRKPDPEETISEDIQRIIGQDEPELYDGRIKFDGGNATIHNKGEAAVAVLDPDEWGLLEDGSVVVIRLTVDDDQEIKDDGFLEKFSEEQGHKAEIRSNVYLELEKKINDADWTRILRSGSPIIVTIDIPEEIRKEGENLCLVVRKADGYVMFKDLDTDPDTITISTDDFESEYLTIAILDELSPAALKLFDDLIEEINGTHEHEGGKCYWHWAVLLMLILSAVTALLYWKDNDREEETETIETKDGKKKKLLIRRKGHFPILIVINAFGLLFAFLGTCHIDWPLEALGVVITVASELYKGHKRRDEEEA
nr:hypothetical protein [Lachnospiraceae bacterium]